MAEPVVRVLDFEGPLDLLIHLIEKNKVDIYDIPIVSIADQYIEQLHALTELDLEAASQFLVMASLLLQIKSRMLLPKPLKDEGADEGDPREMLIRMLVEYRRIKEAAKQLEALRQEAARFHTRQPLYAHSKLRRLHRYPVTDLLEALAGLTGPLRRQVAVVERQEYDVSKKMEEIAAFLKRFPEGVEFDKAFVKTGSSSERVASFLAVLELLRLKVVRISQSRAFAPIYLFLYTEGEADAARG